MNILHISDTPLPDARIEKMAYLSKKRNWKVFFAGPLSNQFALGSGIFDGLHFVPWNSCARIGFHPQFYRIKQKVKKILNIVKPDVIHAHNIFSAKVVSDLGFPFVFDDHELVSYEKRSEIEGDVSNITEKIIGHYEFWRWKAWEEEIALTAPVITVSEGIAEVYRKLGAKVSVVPNYPSLIELSKTCFSNNKERTFTAVYVGDDISAPECVYRNLKGLVDVFKELKIRLVVIGDNRLPASELINSKGYIPHLMLYNVMSRYHVGLVPWKKHWFHKYANPNKPYIYAHSGLVVIVTSSLENVVTAFKGRARTIEDYSDLKEVLLKLSQDINSTLEEGRLNKELALNHFIFEKYECQVMDAYKKAM